MPPQQELPKPVSPPLGLDLVVGNAEQPSVDRGFAPGLEALPEGDEEDVMDQVFQIRGGPGQLASPPFHLA